MKQELFQLALNINEPWFIKDINFDLKSKRLDIDIDFRRGSTFAYECAEYETQVKSQTIDGQEKQTDAKTETSRQTFDNLKAYDTVKKTWRHLNFFEHECYLHTRVPKVKLPNGKTKGHL